MKRAPRSRQRHDLYAKYHDYDSEISDLLGECGINQINGKNDNREIMRLAHAIANHNKAQYGSKYTYAWLFRDALQGIYSNDIPVWKLRWNAAHGQMIKTSTSYKLW